jgi:hypothetical protein
MVRPLWATSVNTVSQQDGSAFAVFVQKITQWLIFWVWLRIFWTSLHEIGVYGEASNIKHADGVPHDVMVSVMGGYGHCVKAALGILDVGYDFHVLERSQAFQQTALDKTIVGSNIYTDVQGDVLQWRKPLPLTVD